MYSLKEKIFLFILASVSIASLFYYHAKQAQAFPAYHINFVIDRREATHKAAEFAKTLNFPTTDYKHITIFQTNDADSTYFQKELGVEKTSQLETKGVDLWHFSTRFFKPLSQDGLTVDFSPNGRLTGFYRKIGDNQPGDRLTSDQAQIKAEEFMRKFTPFRPDALYLSKVQRKEQSNRNDFIMTWQQTDADFGRATNIIKIGVVGSEVASLETYTGVDQAWADTYFSEKNRSDTAQTAAELIETIVFSLAIITMLLHYGRKKQLVFKYPFIIGAVTAVISLVASINNLPISLYSYDPTVPWHYYLVSTIATAVLMSLSSGLLVVPIFAVGSALTKEMFPQHINLKTIITKGSVVKPINKALLVGSFLAFITLAYQVLYYLMGKQFGFWTPIRVNYDDLFSTYLPWSYPLFIGFSAAVMEEGIFRYFGVPFLKKYLKSALIAIIITSISWAFLHSNYEQFPWYVRGIEISVIGLMLGSIYYRYGIVASFTAHFVIDVFLTATSLFGTGFYPTSSAILFILLPIIIAIVGLVIARRAGVSFDSYTLEPSDEVAKTDTDNKQKNSTLFYNTYWFIQKRRIYLLAALATVSLVIIVSLYPKIQIKSITPAITVNEAIERARAVAFDNQYELNQQYKVSATYHQPNNYSMVQLFALTYGSLDQLNAFSSRTPFIYWTVRFALDSPDRVKTVTVLPSGKIYSHFPFHFNNYGHFSSIHLGQQIAEQYLTDRGINLAHYKLIDYEEADYAGKSKLVYQDQNFRIGPAPFLLTVTVRGREVVDLNETLKLPADEPDNLSFFVVSLIFFAILLWLLVEAVKSAVQLLQRKVVNLKEAFTVGAILASIRIIDLVNLSPTFYQSFDGSLNPTQYIFASIALTVTSVLWQFVATSLFIAFFLALWRDQINNPILPTQTIERVRYYWQGLWLSYALPIIVTAVLMALIYGQIKFNLIRFLIGLPSPSLFNGNLPAISLINNMGSLIFPLSLLGSVIMLLYRQFKNWIFVGTFISFCLILLQLIQFGLSFDVFIQSFFVLLVLVLAAVIVWQFSRNNLFVYLGFVYTSMIALNSVGLLTSGVMQYRLNGVALLILFVLPLVVVMILKYRTTKTDHLGISVSPRDCSELS